MTIARAPSARRNAHTHVCTIVPPFILENAAKNGDAAQRESAVRTRSMDAAIRTMRLTGAAPPVKATAASAAAQGAQRTIHDAQGHESFDGPVVRVEGAAATGDVQVDEAYDGLGDTYDFFADVYGRESIDDDGMPLQGHVHFGDKYDNAFWDGTRMVFGDGDMFFPLTGFLDVIGHELTHGVTEDEAQLVYRNQPGALNESVSDVFGSLVRQWKAGETADQADWLIGKGIWKPGVNGVALRSMKEPGTAFDDPMVGKDPQPAHMNDFVVTMRDNGGVHINSGIPNKAFYEVAVAIGGNAWEHAGRIWYDALRDPALKPTARFATFARRTKIAAVRLYGPKATETQAVVHGWDSVGVTIK